MAAAGASSAAVPGLRRNMVTICAMTATIMQALDTTIANVALPYMQGSLSASQDQINWVLTSYIVAAAIIAWRMRNMFSDPPFAATLRQLRGEEANGGQEPT